MMEKNLAESWERTAVNQNQNQGTPSANPSLSQHPAYRGPAPTPGGALPPQGPAHVLQRPFSPGSPYMRHPTQEGPPFGMRHMGPPRGPPPGVPHQRPTSKRPIGYDATAYGTFSWNTSWPYGKCSHAFVCTI
ncbi:hypothetical protein OS493_032041 [Desmophyllum pertusum]|uniref:Uncharacterized protein n=1 Tax=Desmophyllum pertusum TaxID=174260 RepID=A0A9W9YW65_9CNID|nr:hypothetical protein OS493_032041 [Desmophyllum pertusum]